MAVGCFSTLDDVTPWVPLVAGIGIGVLQGAWAITWSTDDPTRATPAAFAVYFAAAGLSRSLQGLVFGDGLARCAHSVSGRRSGESPHSRCGEQ